MKTYRNSKTMWLGNAIIIIGIIQTVQPELQALLPEVSERVWGLITLAFGVAVKVLRLFTVEPIARKRDDAA